MRFFIHLSYDGTAYHGWQIQPNGKTVQEELERCLSVLLHSRIEVVGAGRTDAGVHARHMVAHMDVEVIPDGHRASGQEVQGGQGWCEQLTYRLNSMLPKDISVSRVEQVADDMHARFSATKRTYHYYVHTCKDPFLRQYSHELHYPLDFQKMNEAAEYLLHVDDFASFCKTHTDVKTTLCDVAEARWVQTGEHSWYFVISANRFLRNMVRAVVGTLIEVGRGRITIEEFKKVIAHKKRTAAGESMPANALFLERVEY